MWVAGKERMMIRWDLGEFGELSLTCWPRALVRWILTSVSS